MVTTIQVKDATLDRLKTRKEYARESYDELLNKLLDQSDEGELSTAAIDSIKRGLDDIKRGRTSSLEKVAKEFGVKLG